MLAGRSARVGRRSRVRKNPRRAPWNPPRLILRAGRRRSSGGREAASAIPRWETGAGGRCPATAFRGRRGYRPGKEAQAGGLGLRADQFLADTMDGDAVGAFVEGREQSDDFDFRSAAQEVERPGAVFTAAPGEQRFFRSRHFDVFTAEAHGADIKKFDHKDPWTALPGIGILRFAQNEKQKQK